RLDEVGSAAAATRGIVTARFSRIRQARPGRVVALVLFFAAVAAMPEFLHGTKLHNGQQILALSVAFLSIVAVTGFSGNISLGQAGFAGLGAFLTAKLSTGFFPGLPKMPVIVA